MAQFFTDFSEYTLSTTPADWTVEWGSFNLNIVSGNPVASSDRSFDVDATEVDYTRTAISWDDSGTATQVSVYSRLTTDFQTDGVVGPIVRGGGASSAARTGYYCFLRASGNISIKRASGGTETELGSTTSPFTAATGQDISMELVVDAGGGIDLYAWESASSKPGTPTISVTDGSPLASGWVGFLDSSAAAHGGSDIHAFGVGTGGDAAPTAPLSTTAGISPKTLERLGTAVSATAADVFVWAGHDVDMATVAADHKSLAATITSGTLQEIDLSSTSISPTDNITVVVIPASGGPGIAIETTAEDIS